MTKYIDISVPISPNLPVWPGSPPIKFTKTLDLEKGDSANDTSLNFSVHTGTHVDAPIHFIHNGKSIDKILLDTLIGSVYVAQVPDDILVITPEVLEKLNVPTGTNRLLLRTRNSKLWKLKVEEFNPNFVALTPSAAQWIVDHKLCLVGIDYLSIQRFYDGPETHQILFSADITVIEGLNLSDVLEGKYELICLPVNLKNAEGAPARVVLKI